MSDPTLPIRIRLADISDYGYILETWTKNFHATHPWNFIPNSIYFPWQTARINSILSQVTPLVACLDDDPNQIVGYLCAAKHKDSILLHYAVTKGIYRRLGVMKSLLEQLEYQDKTIVCTHYFGLFKELKDRYHLIYDPTVLEDYVK